MSSTRTTFVSHNLLTGGDRRFQLLCLILIYLLILFQAHVRGFLARKRLERVKWAANVIKRHVRVWLLRQKRVKRDAAARRIQVRCACSQHVNRASLYTVLYLSGGSSRLFSSKEK